MFNSETLLVDQNVSQQVIRYEEAPRICVIGQVVPIQALRDLQRRSQRESTEFLNTVSPGEKLYAVISKDEGNILATVYTILGIDEDKITVHEEDLNEISFIKLRDFKKIFNYVDLAIIEGHCGFFSNVEDTMTVLKNFSRKEVQVDQES